MLRKKKKVKRLIAEGDQLLKDNHLAEAEACYREALTLDDKNAEALYSLGCVAIKREDYSAQAGRL